MIGTWIIRSVISDLCTAGNIPWVKLCVRNDGPNCTLLSVIMIHGVSSVGWGQMAPFLDILLPL